MKYISNETLNHGLGSKILKAITLMGYASMLKDQGEDVEFVYNPLNSETTLSFNYNQLHCFYHKPITNLRDQYIDICNKWESMFNYKGKKIFEVDRDEVMFLVHPHKPGEPLDYGPSYNHTRKIRKEIKDLLNIEKPNTDKKQIIVHIRRADVHPNYPEDRWISDEYYLEVLEVLENKFPSNEYEIQIYSQFNIDREKFSKYKIVADVDLEDHLAWKNMVNADVLCIGKSAYSYSAGVLCDGVVIYPREEMFHPKLNDWKTIDEL